MKNLSVLEFPVDLGKHVYIKEGEEIIRCTVVAYYVGLHIKRVALLEDEPNSNDAHVCYHTFSRLIEEYNQTWSCDRSLFE